MIRSHITARMLARMRPKYFLLFCYITVCTFHKITVKVDTKLEMTNLLYFVLQGMAYIHCSSLGSHGHLRSSCCVVDSRWQIKITSIGLQFLRAQNRATLGMEENQKYRKLLWTAPELLRLPEHDRPQYGTKSGDVFSFAILMQEILYRAAPYFDKALTSKGASQ